MRKLAWWVTITYSAIVLLIILASAIAGAEERTFYRVTMTYAVDETIFDGEPLSPELAAGPTRCWHLAGELTSDRLARYLEARAFRLKPAVRPQLTQVAQQIRLSDPNLATILRALEDGDAAHFEGATWRTAGRELRATFTFRDGLFKRDYPVLVTIRPFPVEDLDPEPIPEELPAP